MRNHQEGYFTRWHADLGYPHLYPGLRELYSDHSTLPSPETVFKWQEDYQNYVLLLRSEFSENTAAATAKIGPRQKEIEDLRRSLFAREEAWCPPPHKSHWKTPVPEKYFRKATCGCQVLCRCKSWSLADVHGVDLVPHEQWNLVQDVLPTTETLASDWDSVTSGDARACLSLCRPCGHYVDKRQLRHHGPVEKIMPHQSGSLMLRSLTSDEDEARGMLGGIVAKDAFVKTHFEMKSAERKALPSLLVWLKRNNPWFRAYSNSVQEIQPFMRQLQEGRLMSNGPFQPGDPNIETALANENIAMFLPNNDFKSATGTYNHLRAAAARVCTTHLREELPAAWQELHSSDLLDEEGKPFSQIPQPLWHNRSFTSVSFRDPHVDAKVFVFQHRWGTGSYHSTLDCVRSRASFRRARFWSLDGVFLDDKDPEWMFWQRESEIKHKLYTDYIGKASTPQTKNATKGKEPVLNGKQLYARQRFSQRVGALVPESAQALTKTKFDWLEMAKSCNLGAPRAMTTVVANSRTSAIRAHIEAGACGVPDPDFTTMSMFRKAERGDTLSNVGIQVADYLRRRRDFETVAYRQGYDALRGRVDDYTRRRENQKRGPCHDHYCEFHESCGLLFSNVPFQASATAGKGQVLENSAAGEKPHLTGCRSCSRYCLRAGDQCVLPEHLSGNAVHLAHHCAPVLAELCRPYPIGSVPGGPDLPPDLRNTSPDETHKALLENFWSQKRICKGAPSAFTVSCVGTFTDRLRLTLDKCEKITALTFGSPCIPEDIVAGYYYRALQTAIPVIHMCKVGYCRASWKDKCKQRFPCDRVEKEMRFDESIQRVVHQRRNLHDDARVISHSLDLLLRTGMNIQINVHHPDDAHKGLVFWVVEDNPVFVQTCYVSYALYAVSF